MDDSDDTEDHSGDDDNVIVDDGCHRYQAEVISTMI